MNATNQQLAGYAPTPVTARMENHGRSMLKVAMQSGQDLFARTGSMVAYEGFVQYEPNPCGRPPDGLAVGHRRRRAADEVHR